MRQNGRKWLASDKVRRDERNKTKRANSYQAPQARRGGEWTTGVTKVLVYDASGVLKRALIQTLTRYRESNTE